MTTIDERLDDTLLKLTTGYTRKELLTFPEEDTGLDEFEIKDEIEAVKKAKAAIRTLFLDLVAEAKPDGRSIVQPDLGEIPDGGYWVHFRGQKYAIDQYKNNLKQAIGEK